MDILNAIDLDIFIKIIGYIDIKYITYTSIEVIKQARLVCKTFRDYIDSATLWQKILGNLFRYIAIIQKLEYQQFTLNEDDKFPYYYKLFTGLTNYKYINDYIPSNSGSLHLEINYAGKCLLTSDNDVIYNGNEEVMTGGVNTRRINISTYTGKIFEYLIDAADPELQGMQQVEIAPVHAMKFLLCNDFTIALCHENGLFSAYAWALLRRYDDKHIRTPVVRVFTTDSYNMEFSDLNGVINIRNASGEIFRTLNYADVFNAIYINYFNNLSDQEYELYKTY